MILEDKRVSRLTDYGLSGTAQTDRRLIRSTRWAGTGLLTQREKCPTLQRPARSLRMVAVGIMEWQEKRDVRSEKKMRSW